jgi:RNA polymerase sigma factor (sigma-70 family)
MAGQPKSESASAEERARMLEGLLGSRREAVRRTAVINSANAADAEDAMQDGCLAFMRFYDGDEGEALSWLLLTVKRFAWKIGNNARRRGSLRHVVTVDSGELTGLELVLADSRPETAELAERAEVLERRIELLKRLKPDERATLILLGLGASYREIAELRGWSRTKVNRCAGEGRARLRKFEAEKGEKT